MKKHKFLRSTLCLLLALVCNVVWAQPEVGKYYKLKTKHDASFVYDNANNNNRLTAISNSDTSIDEEYKIWYLESSTTTGKYTLRNKKTGRYVTPGNEWKTAEAKADFFLYVRTAGTPNYYNLSSVENATGSTCLHCWIGTPGKNWTGEGGGSQYEFVQVAVAEPEVPETPEVFAYTINIFGGESIQIGGQTYANGATYNATATITKSDVIATAADNQFSVVTIDEVNKTINAYFAAIPSQPSTVAYTNAVLYPAQQEAVGAAKTTGGNDVYTLYNNVLAASFVEVGNALFFAGSEAMNLVAGTELFTVAFGEGDVVPASAMTLKNVAWEDLAANAKAVGGAEHFAGKQLVANFEYTYNESKIEIVWRAVLRDGSHYLRTEMELKGVNDVDMFNIIPMIYNVDTKAAGSTPKALGNTRGKVIMSNKIFAGLDTPTAYNTVGGADDEDKWILKNTTTTALEASAWTQQALADVPMRIQEVGGSDKTYCTYSENVTLKKDQKVVVTLTYKNGAKRFDIDGVDLLDQNSSVVASDYHHGYTGSAKENNSYSFTAPNDGEFTVRMYIDKREGDIVSTAEFKVEVYEAKPGVVITTDIVGVQGRWSRNTTLAAGETWKVGSVVGLIAQDGSQANTDIHSTQKRRSFLAYSERERAVPWRANPCYISWYELNINRNNAAPGSEPNNMVADQVLDVLAHWKSDMYDRYGVGANMYIIDDGWDTYGEWNFHAGFPNEMRDIAAAAKELGGAGVGAWLGPVGGYGQSGDYRRQYWNRKGGGMQLSNPAYYAAFKAAATNLVKNQGDNYTFFKFDGISAQFSAVGPDDGDTGNENAEGIIRLERFVREELREDIFFNTTVGTWASPFWYQITDATWRQENDHGEVGNNSNSREKWITYRDNLVHQNYVTASPICPINTLMTHGFILTKFGPPAGNPRDYHSVRNELRAAFLCGSGMVELYNDYDLMNSINGGALWADLAECIAWQKRNADVLPDAHWVGGDPWTGSKSEVYGWAAWNGTKSSLALRNGANDAQTYKFTLRQALNIPANVNGSIILRSAFGVQDALEGLTEGKAYGIDETITVTLPGSSVYGFEGISSTATINNVSSISLTAENDANEVMEGNSLVLRAAVNANATFPAIEWTSSDPEVATVVGGLVQPKKAGTVTITATAKDGSSKTASKTITVTARPIVPPFSTEEAPLWHSVEFKTGGHFLTDKGSGNNLVTAAAADSDEEYWMFIGYNESFKMKSRLGNYVYFEGDRFKTTNDVSKAAELCFVAGVTDGTWELQRVGSTKCMNQNGGSGVGVQLGEWTKNDGNNPFYLNEVEIFDHFIEPVFSDENNEHWFMIRFANGNAHLASNGANDQAVTATLRNVSSQWWKFVGIADNFQLVSKDGRYVTIKSGTATNGQTGNLLHMVSEPDSKGFSIVASPNTNYPGSYEIIWNGATGKSFNQWGGAGAGKSVGVWNVGDGNNPLYIYLPSPNLLTPFDIEGIASYTPASPLTLWYKNAASNMEVSDQWMEYSLPIGNGQFGASIFGGVAREEVQFNEKTLWSGTKNDASSEYGDYENFGSVYIEDISGVFDEGKPVKDYYRQLDLSNATASVHYKSTDGNISFTREYIASYPDKVVAMRLTASEDAKVSIKVTMAAGRPGLRAKTSYNEGTATFGGKLETISYNALVKVVPTGGTMSTDAEGITVTGADEVLIILGGATDFDGTNPNYVSGTEQLPALVKERVDAAAAKSWSTLYAAHVEDHKHFFDRCDFVLDGATNTMPTDDLVREYAKRSTGTESYALMLEQLYFAYGRYLEIGSSRGVDLPANLQGIWNNSSEPAWNADIHANINVQMNYWPAEPTNLSELHMPFLNYIINMANSAEWKNLATKKGATREGAWTMLTENNIFGGFGSFAGNAVINNAWYVSHLWQHYRYTLDEEYLAKAFPAMWGAAMFWIDRLVYNGEDETYECPNEYSPEHGPGEENATAHSQQLVWELFDNTLKAVEILQAEVNADDLATLRDRFAKLDKGLAIEKYTPNGESGKWGEGAIAYGSDLLREWKYSNYYAGANGHRHMSHLMCLYPFNQLTAGTDLFNAAINSMKLRGDASTGWSMGWKINLWARALDGDHSHGILELALRHHSVSGGGVYYNLYDSHSPFQIDGNFGACAGIAEMLMQSHTEVIDILPALPSVWQKGSIRGLKAVGNFTVDIEWENSLAQKVTITSHKGTTLRVRSNHGATDLDKASITINGVAVDGVVVENGVATIPCAQGQTVVIDFTKRHSVAVKVYTPGKRATTLEAGKKYMIYNTCFNGNEDRTGFLYDNGSGLGHTGEPKKKPSAFKTTLDAYLWEVETTDEEGKYYLKAADGGYANASGKTDNATAQVLYIQPWNTSTATKAGVKSEGEDGTVIENANIGGDVFTISGTKVGNTGQDCWNGNPNGFAKWESAHPFAFYEVVEDAVMLSDAFPLPGKTYYIYCDNDTRQYFYNDGGTLKVSEKRVEWSNEYLFTCSFDGTYFQFKNMKGKYLAHKALSDNAHNFELAAYLDGVNLKTPNGSYFVMKADGGFDQSSIGTYDPANTAFSTVYKFEEFNFPVDGETYYIYSDTYYNNEYVNRYMYADGGSLKLNTSLSVTDAYKWTCKVTADGKVQFQNGAGKYLAHKGIQDAPYNFTLNKYNANHAIAATLYSDAASRYFVVKNDGSAFDQSTGTYNQTSADWCTDFVFMPVNDVKVLVVNGSNQSDAQATWNGETKALPASWVITPQTVITDATLSVTGSENYKFTGLYDGATLLGETTEIESLDGNLTLTAKLTPAFFSASTAEQDLVPVRIRNARNNTYTLRLNASDSYTGKAVNSGVTAYGENELWYLVGTENSFKIYNRVAGTGLHVVLAGTGEASAASMNTTATNADFCLVTKDNGYAICPKANTGQSFNMHGGAGADIKLYGSGDGGSIWTIEKMDVNNPVTLNVEVDQVWESSPRVAELTFTIDGLAGQTRILGNVEGQALYLPVGATYEVSSMTYRGYTYNGCEDVDGVLTVSYTANEERTLFYSPRDGHPYRIPAIATAPNGDIFAICDYRPCNMDIGYGEVDLVCRISSDNGETWTDEYMFADGQGDAYAAGDTAKIWQVGFGDPAIVADRESNKVLVMSVCGNQTCWDGTFGDPNPNPNRVARLYITYDEDKQEWVYGEPQEVTYDIYRLFENKNGGEAYVASMFIGAGKICQSRVVKKDKYYRLYCSIWAVTKSIRTHHNYVIYSDDFGQTWNVLGGVGNDADPNQPGPAYGGNEPKCEELPDGTVVLSSRKGGGRYFNLFTFDDDTYTTGSWGTCVSSNNVTGGLSFGGNSTNGEIYKVKAIRKSDGKICDVMLQSIPTGGGRDNVAIYYKEMEYNADGTNKYTPTTFAQGWTKGKHVSTKGSAYSTMILQADGRIGFFFEEEPGEYCMVYIPYTLDELTADKYSLYTVNSTIGQYEIGTFYASEAVVIPEGVKAYVATEQPKMEDQTGVITMTELEGIIPAHTGAVIRGAANTYNFIPSISYGTAVKDNMLVGYEAANNKTTSKKVVTVAADYTTYVLAVENGKAGFYRKVKDATFNVANNKAYLDLTTAVQGAQSLAIRFDDGTTSIEDVEIRDHKSEMIYDLMGRRVETMVKGNMYIVNGKKVVIK